MLGYFFFLVTIILIRHLEVESKKKEDKVGTLLLGCFFSLVAWLLILVTYNYIFLWLLLEENA